MIHIQSIQLIEIQLPLVSPFKTSSSIIHDKRIFLLKITDKSGQSVWSECVAKQVPTYLPEIIDTAWVMIRDWVAPAVLSTTFKHPDEVTPFLNQKIKGHYMAKAAIEMGCWALESCHQNQSLATFLGGTRKQLDTGISIGIQPSDSELILKIKQAVDEGYQKIKLKIEPGQEYNIIKTARDHFGPDLPLMADANNAYTLADLPALKALDTFQLIMIEQPLAWDDIRHHAEVARALETPICLDESIITLDNAAQMIDNKSGKIINIKPGRVGGFSTAKAIHDLCAQYQIPVWCGGMLESGVGRAYNVALASLPNFSIPGDVSASARYWAQDIVNPEWVLTSEGRLNVPTAPGIGVTVDEAYIEKLTIRTETITRKN